MNQAITIIFQMTDFSVLMACAISLVHTIPFNVQAGRWKRALAWIGYGVLAVLVPFLWKSDLVTVSVITIYYLLIGWFLYFRRKMGVICQLFYSVVLYATEVMSLYASYNIFTATRIENGLFLYVLVLLRCILLILGTLLLRLLIQRRFKDVPYLKVHGMVIIPVFSLILLFLFIISSDIFLVRFGYYWVLIVIGLLLVMNLYCLYFWYDVAKSRELMHRLELMEQQKGLTVQYYEEMEKNYNKSRRIIHDIRNHLHAIEQEYRIQDREYMGDVHAMLNSLGMKFYTDCRMLNIVLNDKLKVIPPEHVDCNMGGINLSFLTDMDITTIFANLLENAVEAGRGREDFWIRIRGERIQDFIIVKISNPIYTGFKEGQSTKPGHRGIGLGNVRQAVGKYQGEIEIHVRDGLFSVTLVFGDTVR